jgi:hypothetical protein
MKNEKSGEWCGVVGLVLVILVTAGLSGCGTLDRAYKQEVTWTNAPVVHVVTNTVVETRTIVDPAGTNVVTEFVTNFVPVFYTNLVQVPLTNLVARPEALASIEGTGAVINAFMPGIGSVVALALGGLYHGYRQIRNRKVNEALVQGVETAREILTTTPQGQAADAQFVKWLMEHQKEAGVFATVSGLVDELSDNPAARLTAQEIAERVERAEGSRSLGVK